MARLNIYVPDDLAKRARDAQLNVSGLAQEAIRGALTQTATDRWLDALDRLPTNDIPHHRVIAAMDQARDGFGA